MEMRLGQNLTCPTRCFGHVGLNGAGGGGGVEQALGYHMTARLLIAFLCQLSVAFMLIGIDPGPILLIVLCLFASFH